MSNIFSAEKRAALIIFVKCMQGLHFDYFTVPKIRALNIQQTLKWTVQMNRAVGTGTTSLSTFCQENLFFFLFLTHFASLALTLSLHSFSSKPQSSSLPLESNTFSLC